jgi:hypothetical protein
MRFICFSSGAQRQYRDDIIRAMGMPTGCELTFRYRYKYLSRAVQDYVSAGKVSGADEVLICYLDQADRSRPIDFIPVRYATLIEAPVIGDFVVLRMRVQHFAVSENLEAFNSEVQSLSAEVPKWPKETEEKDASKVFWLEVNDYPTSVIKSASVSDWQKMVGHLLARTDFATTGPFYQIVRLHDLKTQASVEMKEGEYSLQPGTQYEMLIDHFLPTSNVGNSELEASVAGIALTFITGAKIQIDSPYSRHWIRFKTGEPIKDERVVITINKKESGEDSTVQFDLPISISGRLGKTIWVGLAAGLLLAIPQITTAWVNPSYTPRGLAWLIGLSAFIAFFNLAVGVAASLNFRRPI